MKILAASRHPASGEAIAPLVAALRDRGHPTCLVGVRNDTPETKHAGGAASIFERQRIRFLAPEELGFFGDPLQVPVSWAENLIGRERPDVLLVGASHDPTGRDQGIEDALIVAADRAGLKSVQVIDTFGTWHPRQPAVHPTVYTVGNEFVKQVMVARGAPEGRIRVTGQPAQDMYAELPERGDNRAEKEKAGLARYRVIAFFTQGEPGNRRVLPWILNSLGPDDYLIIARHPRDQEEYTNLIEPSHNRVVFSSCGSDDLLSLMDVCLTRYSTMGFKAALQGIPTINVLPDEDWRDVRKICGGFPLALAGGSIEVHSGDELANVLQHSARPDRTRTKQWLKIDGKSTERIIDLILE